MSAMHAAPAPAVETPEPTKPLDPTRPFSRSSAQAAGITLRSLLGPTYHKVVYNRYVLATVPITLELRAQAALEVSPRASYLSHHTAARLWGAVVPESPDVHVSVLARTAQSARSVRQGLRSHLMVAEPATTVLRGLRVSTPEQAFLDLAGAGLDLVDLVVAGDSLVKGCRTSPEKLVAASAAWRGAGAKRARAAARRVRAGVDSPMETRLRLLLVLAGLPEPEVNLMFRHPDGSWKRRFDLAYPGLTLIVEYDGRQHAENTQQWQHDLKRREELDALGWRIIIVTKDDLRQRPEEVLDRVRDAMRSRGATGLRRSYRTDWIRHFRRDS